MWLSHTGRRSSSGELTGEKLSTSWLELALYAITAQHEAHGFVSPTSEPMVRKLIDGYARAHAKAPVQAHAMRLDELAMVATTLLAPEPDQTRDRTLVLVATEPFSPLNASQLGRLDWSEVFLDPDPAAPASLHVAGQLVELAARPADPRICPVAALSDWALLSDGAQGPVFKSPRDASKPMTRQAIRQRLDTIIAGAKLKGVVVLRGLPRLSPRQQLELVSDLSRLTDAQVRDLAVMSLLWFGQLRRSELAAFDCGDLTLNSDSLLFRVRQSKTDPYGEGASRNIVEQPKFVACPVKAWSEWKKSYEALLDRPVVATDPAFQSLHLGGALSGRLSGAAVNDLFQRRCADAGVEADPGFRISSHAGRAGGATEMLLRDIEGERVAHFSRRTASSLKGYMRPGMRNNPTAGLAASAGASSSFEVTVEDEETIDTEDSVSP